MKNKFTYVLNVVSNDHPGIVAAVSSAVHHIGGNIESCSQTVLDGYFTFILVVSFSEKMDADEISALVKQHGGLQTGYKVVALPMETSGEQSRATETDVFVITAFGKDRPGIVKEISKYLADKQINILDFYTRCDGGEFTMMGQVQIPSRLDLRMLQADLEAIGEEFEFTVQLQHNNIFVATNELRLQNS